MAQEPMLRHVLKTLIISFGITQVAGKPKKDCLGMHLAYPVTTCYTRLARSSLKAKNYVFQLKYVLAACYGAPQHLDNKLHACMLGPSQMQHAADDTIRRRKTGAYDDPLCIYYGSC